MIKGEPIGVISDANGFYRLVGLADGSFELTVSYIGFESVTQTISIGGSETKSFDFLLEPGVQLGEVVIGGVLQGEARAMNVQMNNSNISNVVSADLMAQYPDANIGDALKRITGINVQYDQGEARSLISGEPTPP